MASEMSKQLIDGDGNLKHEFNGFMGALIKRVNFGEDRRSYRVVSIIGHQSSGKSTLLNHLFQTNFEEMDSSKGRHKTTAGIWLATSAYDPSMLIVDVEGTDGKERGMDDTTFGKQSALFALAVSDIIIINMWCHEIGREEASNMPLLRIVFQVLMQLFKPHKTMLLFAIRDKTKSPLAILEQQLKANISEIWDNVIKLPDQKDTQLDAFFSMEFVTLPNYEDKEHQFKEQVEHLRTRFFGPLGQEGLASNRKEVPITEFAHTVEWIWKRIKENKELDLPKLTKMVATFRCEEIIKDKLSLLMANEEWRQLKSDASLGPVDGFGKRIRKILDSYLSEYDMETALLDKGVCSAKRPQLTSEALADAYPAYRNVVRNLSRRNLDKFKNDFDQVLQGREGNDFVHALQQRREGFAVAAENCRRQCLSEFEKGCADAYVETASWDPSDFMEMLGRDIDEHMAEQLAVHYEKQLSESLRGPVGSLLSAADSDTWLKIRDLLGCEAKAKEKDLSCNLSNLKIDEETTRKMLTRLAASGRRKVEETAGGYAKEVVNHMSNKFHKSFGPDEDWTMIDIATTAKYACSKSLELLSVMAAIRLDDQPDNIQNTLLLALKVDVDSIFTSGSSTTSIGTLASSMWEGVAAANVLITPEQCKLSWKQFKENIQPFLGKVQMMATEMKANKAAKEEAEKVAKAKTKDAEDAKARAEEAEKELQKSKDKMRGLMWAPLIIQALAAAGETAAAVTGLVMTGGASAPALTPVLAQGAFQLTRIIETAAREIQKSERERKASEDEERNSRVQP